MRKEQLKEAFYQAMVWPTTTPGFRALSFASAYWLSSDRHPIRHTPILRLIHARKDIGQLIAACEIIDDCIDSTAPENITSCDFSIGPDGISNFVRNESFVPKTYLHSLSALVEQGLIESTIATGFTNLFCDYVQKKAVLQQNVDSSGSDDARLKMAHENIKMGALFGCFFFGLLSPIKKGAVTKPDEVTHGFIQRQYPEAFHINRAGQLLDDFFDLAQDVCAEKEHGFSTTNIILARAYMQPSGRHDITTFKALCDKNTTVAIDKTPPSIRIALQKTYEDFLSDMSHIKSTPSRLLLESFWFSTARGGFETPSHEKSVTKREHAALTHSVIR